MAKGKKTGGRRKGTPNRSSVAGQAAFAAIAEKVEALIPGAFDGDAHTFLMMVYRDPDIHVQTRLEAAGKAIQFEKPRLAAVQHTGREGGPIEMLLQEIDGTTRGPPGKAG